MNNRPTIEDYRRDRALIDGSKPQRLGKLFLRYRREGDWTYEELAEAEGFKDHSRVSQLVLYAEFLEYSYHGNDNTPIDVSKLTERRFRDLYGSTEGEKDDRFKKVVEMLAQEPAPSPRKPTVRRKLTPEMEEWIGGMLQAGIYSQEQIAEKWSELHPDQKIAREPVKIVAARLDVDPPDVPETQKDKFERALRRARMDLRGEIRNEVEVEVGRIYQETILPNVNKKHERAERIIASHKGIMPRDLYRKLLACLHPDSTDGAQWRNEMFDAVKKLEDVLVKADVKQVSGVAPPLPKTLAELRSMKRTKTV